MSAACAGDSMAFLVMPVHDLTLTIVAPQGGVSPWSNCAIGRSRLGPVAAIDLLSETAVALKRENL
jgi:hypothetical protein